MQIRRNHKRLLSRDGPISKPGHVHERYFTNRLREKLELTIWHCTVPRPSQSKQSAKRFLQSSELGNWDFPSPSPPECVTPRWFRGEGHIRLRERGWESPYSDEGTYTAVLYIYVYFVASMICRYEWLLTECVRCVRVCVCVWRERPPPPVCNRKQSVESISRLTPEMEGGGGELLPAAPAQNKIISKQKVQPSFTRIQRQINTPQASQQCKRLGKGESKEKHGVWDPRG